MWPVGASSVSMSPGCMQMDRTSPPGGIPAFAVTAQWVQFVLYGKVDFMWLDFLYDVFALPRGSMRTESEIVLFCF